jgi:ATP-dependent DNA helicase RecG
VSGDGTPSRRPLRRSTPLRYLRGVGPRRAESLAAAGLETVEDLLYHLPLRYEDRRRVVTVAEVDAPGQWTVRGTLAELRAVRTRRRGFVIVRGRLVGAGRALAVAWFNQPYLLQRLTDGAEVTLHGAVRASGIGQLELVNPAVASAEGARGILPVYPRLAGLGPAAVGRLLAQVAEVLETDPPPDPLPASLLRRYALPPLAAALATLHRPEEEADPAALTRRESPAHARLAYGELLELQVALAELRRAEVRVVKLHRYRIDDDVRAVARRLLPFRLTGAQKRVVREIVDDLRAERPMLRLLQGDVGSGKTIVAALALLIAVESGLQAAYMAPTELLAEQQFGVLARLLGDRHAVGLLTSSNRGPQLRAALARGEPAIAVGTHALIQGDVRFARLALAVIDEQHRFGVEQRRLLQAKGARPDVLVMTATPIPRSLALTLYGDLEVSLLDELPPGRTPIVTEVVSAAERRRVYRELDAALAGGAQAYVVLPLIEESEEIAAASLAEHGRRVREHLGAHRSAILHGRLPAAEREELLRRFAAGEIRVLVATTVVEVGLDVPAATWMVIESAERFGLAQLHQLRGRVGRGAAPSRCVAIHGRTSEEAERRLATFAAIGDGFALAEADLAQRGPGDLLGKRQAGLPSLRLADLVAHLGWLERARSDAREILARAAEPEFAAFVAWVRDRLPDRDRALAGG